MKKVSEAIPNLRLQQARKSRNWLQQDIATAIGTTPVNVSRWEQGVTFPSPNFRAKLSELFSMSLEELGLLAEVSQENKCAFAPALSSPVSPIEKFPSPLESVTSFPIWNIPYPRNPLFTGRDEILSRLHNKFFMSNALYGLFGRDPW